MGFFIDDMSKEIAEKHSYIHTRKWVINKEKDAFLIYNGKSEDGLVYFFEMHWKDSVIKIETIEKDTPLDERTKSVKKYNVLFTITKVSMPSRLETSWDDVRELINFSLKSWGRFGNKKRTAGVTVSYQQKDEDGNELKLLELL